MIFELRLGDELYGEIQSSCDRAGEWVVISPEAPGEWTGKLSSRTKRLYEPGDKDWFWVYRTNSQDQRYWVSDNNFGRMPISDRVRPKYIRAARALLAVMAPAWRCDDSLLDDLSEMKGIFNRCRKKDQWDWLTLYHYLEDPPSGLLEYSASSLHDLRRAIRRGEESSAQNLVRRIENSIPIDLMRRFLERVEESSPRLIQLRETPRPETGERARDDTRSTLGYNARVKLERANEVHQNTLARLSAALAGRGYVVEENKLIDLACRLETGPAIFEVKSITPANERAQCRHALSQLYEYRYLHGVENASLWIMLSGRPSVEWIVDYLLSDRNINVLWLDDGRISGPSLERLGIR